MTLTTIEKAAKLMGISINCQNLDDEKYYLAATGFNPYTKKADLVDVVCELGIDVCWRECSVLALTSSSVFAFGVFADHPDKKTALAHAVVEVAVQIYDRKFGGE